MAHTPGPHRIDKEILNYQGYINLEVGNRYAGCIKSEDNMVLAVVIDDDTPGEDNLKLYAAASELLEACREVRILLNLDEGPLSSLNRQAASARLWLAVIKATGE